MNQYETNDLVNRCLESGTGLWIDTDMGDVDLFGSDLEDAWESLAPGEGFKILGVITKKETA